MTMSQKNNHEERAPSIRNCIWGFKWDKAWDKPTQTEVDTVRFCGHCQKEVYLCDDDESVVNQYSDQSHSGAASLTAGIT